MPVGNMLILSVEATPLSASQKRGRLRALVFSWWTRRCSGLVGEFLGKGLMGWLGPQVFRMTNMCLRTGQN